LSSSISVEDVAAVAQVELEQLDVAERELDLARELVGGFGVASYDGAQVELQVERVSSPFEHVGQHLDARRIDHDRLDVGGIGAADRPEELHLRIDVEQRADAEQVRRRIDGKEAHFLERLVELMIGAELVEEVDARDEREQRRQHERLDDLSYGHGRSPDMRDPSGG